jgi:hypothetical protein
LRRSRLTAAKQRVAIQVEDTIESGLIFRRTLFQVVAGLYEARHNSLLELFDNLLGVNSGLGIRNLDIVERTRPSTEARTLLNRCSLPSEKTVPEEQLENLKLQSRGLFDEVKVMVEKTEVQLAGERMRVAGLLG